ncbi:MAG: flagellar type III secretion system pore protein FliP [Pseudomonadota bacterium]
MNWRFFFCLFSSSCFLMCFGMEAFAQDELAFPEEETSELVRIAIILTLLAIVPALFISMTSFMRIVIVLAMVRHAFGMPETPPNQVLISLALFLSLFVMTPTLQAINQDSLQPFLSGDLGVEEAVIEGADPIKSFMMSQVRDSDLETMYAITQANPPDTEADVGMLVLIPAFVLNELRLAFTIGFIVLLPFLLIDLIVSSVLLSLGMMMVPPATIALPIKILMFVIIDGWSLVIEGLLGGFL